MGITGFTTFVKEVVKHLSPDEVKAIFKQIKLSSINKSLIILDANALLIRYGSIKQGDSFAERTEYALSGIINLINRLKKMECNIIVVSDSEKEPCGSEDALSKRITSFRRNYAHLKSVVDTSIYEEAFEGGEVDAIPLEDSNRIPLVTAESVRHAKDITHKARSEARLKYEAKTGEFLFKVTANMSVALEALCRFMDVQFHRCLVEADGLMAGIARRHARSENYKTVYMMTEDSDLFIYDSGFSHILRHCSVTGRLKGNTYEDVNIRQFWKTLGITNQNLLYRIPLLMKCDYFNGIGKIGPLSILRYITLNWDNFKSNGINPSVKNLQKLQRLVYTTNPNITLYGPIDTQIDYELMKKEMNKLKLSRELLRELSYDDLIHMDSIPRLVERPVIDIDMFYSETLSEDVFEGYVTALFRFVEGANYEMDFYTSEFRIPTYDRTITLVIPAIREGHGTILVNKCNAIREEDKLVDLLDQLNFD